MEGDERKSKWVTEVVIKGDESRAGNGCCGEEQMATGGVVMAAVHGRPPHAGPDPHSHSCSAFVHPSSTFLNISINMEWRVSRKVNGRLVVCAGCCQTYWVRNHAEMR